MERTQFCEFQYVVPVNLKTQVQTIICEAGANSCLHIPQEDIFIDM
jgi:hypothetical protein